MTPFQPGRAETRSISVAASPEQVVAYLADPRHIPDWAPGFASAVDHDHGDVWRVETGAGAQRVAVKVSADHGVVDVVSADDPTLGLFTRVVPNLTGAEVIFSLFFPPDTDPAAVDAQMDVVDQELRAVRERVEA